MEIMSQRQLKLVLVIRAGVGADRNKDANMKVRLKREKEIRAESNLQEGVEEMKLGWR